MGTITVKVSDLTGELIEDDAQLARLVVEGHPDFPEPITLEVLPSEIDEQLPTDQDFVILSYYHPTDPTPKNFLMPLEEFNNLSKQADMTEVLRNAYQNQHEEATRSRGRRGSRRQPRQARQRIDYSSPEHAGEPHRGTVSQAEKDYVRQHLNDVNRRLREKSMREIDPLDPYMAARYGFEPPVAHDDPEAEGVIPQE